MEIPAGMGAPADSIVTTYRDRKYSGLLWHRRESGAYTAMNNGHPLMVWMQSRTGGKDLWWYEVAGREGGIYFRFYAFTRRDAMRNAATVAAKHND